jgi:hypothetical protein
MPDDTSKRGQADRQRINVHEEHELKYWADHFHVTHAQLKAAVAKVGPMVNAVRKHLGL